MKWWIISNLGSQLALTSETGRLARDACCQDKVASF
jgi:hypothetical protein